jgi:hypothetical protein
VADGLGGREEGEGLVCADRMRRGIYKTEGDNEMTNSCTSDCSGSVLHPNFLYIPQARRAKNCLQLRILYSIFFNSSPRPLFALLEDLTHGYFPKEKE